MLRTENALIGSEGFPWGSILLRRSNMVVDASAYNPLQFEGTASDDDYLIPAGTHMVPGSGLNGRYIQVQRALAVSMANANADTQIIVEDASPFRVGDTCRYRDANDDYAVAAIGVITAIDYATNELEFAGVVAAGLVADDVVEVAYNDADQVLLEAGVQVQDPNGNLVSKSASGVIAGQVSMAALHIVGDWDVLLAQEMTGMDFVPVEPGTGKSPSAVIGTTTIADKAVTTAKLDDDAVTGDQIADLAVDTEHLAALAVKTAKIALLAVDTAQLALLAVHTGQIADDAVTAAKIATGVAAPAMILALPVTLSKVNNTDHILDGWVPGFAGILLKLSFVTGDTPATTAAKDIDIQAMINAQATTGGLLTLLTANVDVQGEVTEATAISANNVFGAADTLSIHCVQETAAFIEGNGTVLLVIGAP